MKPHLELQHWSDVDWDWWDSRFPNFHPREIACNGSGILKVHIPSLEALQRVRKVFGKPMFVTSAYRSSAHNKRVGGALRSQHLTGRAFDIAISSTASGQKLEALARKEGARGIGRYPDRRFIHLDWRDSAARTWGRW
jgi:uncharacterized protein YcbK (DUF882 family)